MSDSDLEKEFQIILEECKNKCISLSETIKSQILSKKDKIINYLQESNINSSYSLTFALLRQEEFIYVYDKLNTIIKTLKDKCEIISSSKECPIDIRNNLDTFIYAIKTINEDEFIKFRDKIKQKFGEDYIAKAENNADKFVDEILINNIEVKGFTLEKSLERMKNLYLENKTKFKKNPFK